MSKRFFFFRPGEGARVLARCQFEAGRCGATFTYPIPGYPWRRNVMKSFEFELSQAERAVLLGEVTRLREEHPAECLADDQLWNDTSEEANGITRDKNSGTLCVPIAIFGATGERREYFAMREDADALLRSRVPVAGVHLSGPWLLIALVATPVPALAIGVMVMRSAGLPTILWSQNVVAAVLGALLCVGAAARRRRRPASTAAPWLAVVGAAALAATFVSPGIEGVHRWVGVGPLRLHVAATLLPAMLAVLYDAGCGRRTAVYGPIVVSVALLAQPDAAQASAFAVAWAIIAGARRRARETSGALVVLALGAATLFRSDPLGPVPYVEGILSLAQTQSASRAVVGGLSLLLLPLPFMLDPSQRWLGAAVAAYMLCIVLAASVGNYPVPVMGYGAAPILGYYFGATEFVKGSRLPDAT